VRTRERRLWLKCLAIGALAGAGVGAALATIPPGPDDGFVAILREWLSWPLLTAERIGAVAF
jgi:hypothetical protein